VLHRFEARGYRNLDTAVSLARCTVLIGPNNCGKSNLMRAIGFAADGARTSEQKTWAEVIRQHGGNGLVHRDAPRFGLQQVVTLRWMARFEGGEWRQELGISRGPTEPMVVTDDSTTTFPGKRALRCNFRDNYTVVSWDDVVGTALSKETFPLLGQLAPEMSSIEGLLRPSPRNYLRSQLHVSLAGLMPRRIGGTWSEEGSAKELLPDASNLAPHLKYLENEHADGLTSITTALADLLPGLSRTWVRSPEGSGATWVEFAFGKQAVPLRELSDGTVVGLLLATLLHGPRHRELVMLDEPELNLHPAWLKVVARWLQAPSAAGQVILSTHSTDLLDALTDGFRAGDVAVLRADGKFGFVNVTPAELQPFFDQGYALGDLYRVGEPVLGGWPW
jgi:predicted ATPase